MKRVRFAVCLITLVSLGVIVATARAAEKSAAVDGPRTPAEALESFRVEAGLKLELVAAEPLVVSPCALTFDEHGRMFVAENRGYPTGPGEGQPPIGRIVLLEDKDGDGQLETRTDFATELTFPNGLLPWRGGLIVTCSPEVLYLKDNDGDGKADERRVLLTGFDTKGSTQLRVSHPTLGLDGWVYLTSGLTGGKVISPLRPDAPPVEVRRTDLRFHPDTGEVEAADGGAQFGQTFDDFGRRFICYNRVHVQHVVLNSKYLKRNPHLAFAETVENCPAEMAPEPLRGHGNAARVFPISSNVTTADSHAGTFTAACAVTIYRGTQLPPEYLGAVFACDPTGNLVHVDRLESRGATFAAHRMHAEREVLASTDNWFRPVFLSNAPDGALYLCDMYRKTIEHPDYLPVEVRKHTDFESGKTMGRIYRLTATQRSSDAPHKNTIAGADLETLCDLLAHPNGWWRDTAMRLLWEGRDARMVGRLKARLDADIPPAAIVIALSMLDKYGELDSGRLSRALQHREPGVREIALQLAESRLSADILERVLTTATDEHPRVRLLTALVLGNSNDTRTLGPLAQIALRPETDRWTRAAVLSSVAARESSFLQHVLEIAAEQQVGTTEFFYDLGRLVGASQTEANLIDALVSITAVTTANRFDRQAALLTGLGDALKSRGFSRGHDGSALHAAVAKTEPPMQEQLAQRFQDLLKRAESTAAAVNESLERRKVAITLAGHFPSDHTAALLAGLVDSQQPDVVQIAAVRTLSGMPLDSIAPRLLSRERFNSFTPRLREEVISALVASPRHLPGLLTAIEDGVVPAASIDTLRRRQMTQSRDAAIRDRATQLFGAGPSGDRAKVYEEYKAVVGLRSNAENGKQVFKRACASCHRLDREGTPVGPDLFGIRNQPKEAILLHILVPEQEITPGFTAYIVTTKDGRVLTGLIAAETATTIVLRQALGKEEAVLRQDIEELVASNLSLMPQGVEKTISKQEFADLLSYLKGERS